MSKKANHLMIGVFVLGAIAIAVAGIVILSAGLFFKDTQNFVMYFDGDLSGLDVGAPMDIKGVKVGKVLDISIVYDYHTKSVSVPVIVELDKGCFSEINCEEEPCDKKGMELQIKKGLRAQLKAQSMVTGKLKIALVYDKAHEPVFRAKNTDLTEIPTIPGALDSLARKMSELPFEEIVLNIQSITESLSTIVDSDKITQVLDSFDGLAKKVNSLPIESIAADMQVTSKAISSMASSGNLQKIMESVNSTLAESHELMVTINKESRPFKEEMLIMMEQFGEAAESIKNLSDYIERHPESLIHGKGKE